MIFSYWIPSDEETREILNAIQWIFTDDIDSDDTDAVAKFIRQWVIKHNSQICAHSQDATRDSGNAGRDNDEIVVG